MDNLVLVAFCVRILLALCTRTFFQPDEYFQSLEPAHHIVFGYGHLTWEWLNPRPIRSVIYPALNVPIFAILRVSGIDSAGALGDWLMIAAPRILHGTLAAFTDISIAEIARNSIGPAYSSSAVFFSLTSFFHVLSLSRSLSNSLETSLTALAFAHYPWDASPKLSVQVAFRRARLRRCILFSALACMIRPTNAVIWVFLYINFFWAIKQHKAVVWMFLFDIGAIGSAAIALVFALDTAYYGKPTFTPLNFLATNISSVASFYGSNPWHYYITQALPILCTTALPFALHGIWSTIAKSTPRDTPLRTMLMTLVWTISIYSLGDHKEWRFLHPLLPLLHVFAAKSIVDLSNRSLITKSKTKAQIPQSGYIQPLIYKCNLQGIKLGYLFFTLLTLPASIFVAFIYQSGPISVLAYLRSEVGTGEVGTSIVGFLMPCHSTPGFAYLHRKSLAKGGSWALGCEPPLQNQLLSEYRDQTDIFFDSPQDYLESYFPTSVNPAFPPSPQPTSVPGKPAPEPMLTLREGKVMYPWGHEWPRYLVFFGHLLQQEGVKDILEDRGYLEVWQGGWEFEGDEKRKGGVRVWKWFDIEELD